MDDDDVYESEEKLEEDIEYEMEYERECWMAVLEGKGAKLSAHMKKSVIKQNRLESMSSKQREIGAPVTMERFSASSHAQFRSPIQNIISDQNYPSSASHSRLLCPIL